MQSFSGIVDHHVKLDDYICDLNLDITNGGYSCVPLSSDGFSYMWGGVKGSFGIRSGKVCFEVKIDEYCEATNKDPTDTYVARVGWSTDSATLQLGEDKNSFGFGGTGKKSANRKFLNYGRRYEKGDVVGCYLAMENGWVDISYSVNGRYCGSAFKIRWMTDEALFPHILTKNCKLDLNFGQAAHPYFSLQPGYKLISHIPVDLRIPGVRSPLSQRECEVIMMVGLPGVGKSTWAMNYAKIHPSKKYVVLGTDSIIDKMRVMGLPRKNNFTGRWDVLIKQASDCFNILLKKASSLPRNLILDQTNVYASARRRKVKQYREKGYIVNAMVLVPRDEDMIRRSQQRTVEEGKEVPEAAVLDMKANFSLPDEAERLFDNITFLELQRPEAQQLVEQYNKEALNRGHQSNQQRGVGINKNQAQRRQFDRMSAPSMDQSHVGRTLTPAYNQNRSHSEQTYQQRAPFQNNWSSGSQERQTPPQPPSGPKRPEPATYSPHAAYGRSTGPVPSSSNSLSYSDRSPKMARQGETSMTYQEQQQQAFTDKWNEQIPKKQAGSDRPSRWGPDVSQEKPQTTPSSTNVKTEYGDYGNLQQTGQPSEANWPSRNQRMQQNRGVGQQGYYTSPQAVSKPEPKFEKAFQADRRPFPMQHTGNPRSNQERYDEHWGQDLSRVNQNQGQRYQESQQSNFREDDSRPNQQYDQSFPKQEQYDDNQAYGRQNTNIKQEKDRFYDEHGFNDDYEDSVGSNRVYNQQSEQGIERGGGPQSREAGYGPPDNSRQNNNGGQFSQQSFQRDFPGGIPQHNRNDFNGDEYRQQANNQPTQNRPNRPQNDSSFHDRGFVQQPFVEQPPYDNRGPPQMRKPLLGHRPDTEQQPNRFSGPNYQEANYGQMQQNRFDGPPPPRDNRSAMAQFPSDNKSVKPKNEISKWNTNQDDLDQRGSGQFDLTADDQKQLLFFDQQQQQSMITGNQPLPAKQRSLPSIQDESLQQRREERSRRDEQHSERPSRRDRERSPIDRFHDRDGSRSRRDERRNRDDRRARGDEEKRSRSSSKSRDDRGERRRDRDDPRSRHEPRTKREDRGGRRSSPTRRGLSDRRSPRRSDPGRGGSNCQEEKDRHPLSREGKGPEPDYSAPQGGAKPGLLPTPKQNMVMPIDNTPVDEVSELYDCGADQATLSKLASVDFDKLKASLANIRKTHTVQDDGDWADPGYRPRGFVDSGGADMEIEEPMMQNRTPFHEPRMPHVPLPRAPRGPLLRTPRPMGQGQLRGPVPPVRPHFRPNAPEDAHFEEQPPKKILLATPGEQEPPFGFDDGPGFDQGFGMGDFPGPEYGGPPGGMPFGGPPPRFPGFRGPRPRMPRGFGGGMRFRGARHPSGPRPGIRMMGRGMRPPRPQMPMRGPM